jgi:ribose transport system substrate-binding protein
MSTLRGPRPSLSKPLPRVRRMSDARRDELLDQVENLILAHGFTAFTMDDLAAQVKCSKSTLYALSPSKESLVATIIRRFFDRVDSLVERQVALIHSQRERVAVYLSALGHAMKRMSGACYEDMMLLPVTREIYEVNSQSAADRVHEFIERGIEDNEFRAANARFIGKAVSLLIDGIQHGLLLDETGLTSGDAYAELGSLVLNALTNRASAEFPAERFVRSDEAGEVPDLPARVAYANLGDAEIFSVWGDAMQSAAEARGLEYLTASADFDPATNVDQIHSFVNRGVAALLTPVLDAPSQRPAVLEAMEAGVAVFTVAFGPSTVQMLTDQYASGQAAAEAMVGYINTHLDGNANILMFNLDDREGIRPRYQAVRDVVAAAGDDINITVDQLGSPQTSEYGFEVMNTVLQSNPDVNVVIGEDAHVLGALAALQAAGTDHDERWLLVGIGGEQQALEEVADDTSPLKIDISFALPTIGVIPGRFAEDWLAGRAIPTVVAFNPIVLDSAETVDQFLTDMANPETLFDSPKQDTYLTMLGNISYQNRMSYYATGHAQPIMQTQVPAWPLG